MICILTNKGVNKMSAVKKLDDCEKRLRRMVDNIADQINGDKPIDPGQTTKKI